jgi:transposase
MDNAKVHHGDHIIDLAARFGTFWSAYNRSNHIDPHAAGVRIVYLPPYSPDFNPIEEAYSKIKAFIRRNDDIFLGDLDKDYHGLLYDMMEAMKVITADDAIGYFIHAGYF